MERQACSRYFPRLPEPIPADRLTSSRFFCCCKSDLGSLCWRAFTERVRFFPCAQGFTARDRVGTRNSQDRQLGPGSFSELCPFHYFKDSPGPVSNQSVATRLSLWASVWVQVPLLTLKGLRCQESSICLSFSGGLLEEANPVQKIAKVAAAGGVGFLVCLVYLPTFISFLSHQIEVGNTMLPGQRSLRRSAFPGLVAGRLLSWRRIAGHRFSGHP